MCYLLHLANCNSSSLIYTADILKTYPRTTNAQYRLSTHTMSMHNPFGILSSCRCIQSPLRNRLTLQHGDLVVHLVRNQPPSPQHCHAVTQTGWEGPCFKNQLQPLQIPGLYTLYVHAQVTHSVWCTHCERSKGIFVTTNGLGSVWRCISEMKKSRSEQVSTASWMDLAVEKKGTLRDQAYCRHEAQNQADLDKH